MPFFNSYFNLVLHEILLHTNPILNPIASLILNTNASPILKNIFMFLCLLWFIKQ